MFKIPQRYGFQKWIIYVSCINHNWCKTISHLTLLISLLENDYRVSAQNMGKDKINFRKEKIILLQSSIALPNNSFAFRRNRLAAIYVSQSGIYSVNRTNERAIFNTKKVKVNRILAKTFTKIWNLIPKAYYFSFFIDEWEIML